MWIVRGELRQHDDRQGGLSLLFPSGAGQARLGLAMSGVPSRLRAVRPAVLVLQAAPELRGSRSAHPARHDDDHAAARDDGAARPGGLLRAMRKSLHAAIPNRDGLCLREVYDDTPIGRQ
jgi:hypothetical protein